MCYYYLCIVTRKVLHNQKYIVDLNENQYLFGSSESTNQQFLWQKPYYFWEWRHAILSAEYFKLNYTKSC